MAEDPSHPPAPRGLAPGAVDVVVVSYQSSGELRDCVAPLAGVEGISVVVVDNASTDKSLEAVAGLPVDTVAVAENRGFGAGCNAGWRRGRAPFVLFLNPDARLGVEDLFLLVDALEQRPTASIVGPRILDAHGRLHHSIRRFPTLRSSYAQALFLHRALPRYAWTDEVVGAKSAYALAAPVDWVSGACLLVRRSLLEALDGFDERFFLYCEDKDLCRRAWNLGSEVWFDPRAVARHAGGASAPRGTLLPVLAESRLLYASKHRGRPAAVAERLAVALHAATHALASRRGPDVRAGHARSLRRALSRS